MKKICLALIVLFITTPALQAATLESARVNQFTYHKKDTLELLTIAAQADQEITAEHGIRLMLDKDVEVLWEDTAVIQASGLAVDNGKMAVNPVATYSDDHKDLHIAVMADFNAGESVILENIQVRTYAERVKSSYIKMDMNGDLEPDVQDWWDFRVSEFDRKDRIAPYEPYDFTAEIADDLSSVTVTWKNPLDADFKGIILDKILLRQGITSEISLLEQKDFFTEFIDADIQEGDDVTYKIVAYDKEDNFSEWVVLDIKVEAEEEVDEEESPQIPEDTTPKTPEEEEAELLDRLFNYYKVRQAIKCLRNDSACLWSKINLIYAQEKLGRSGVDISLSERDLYLMGIRIRFTEDRYQRNCIDAEEPAKTCTALGRSIKRARYFLD